MKVLFTTNVPSPYRVDFFNELGKYCDLTVLFELKNAKDRDEKWKSDEFCNFKAIFLKGLRIGADQAICLDVLKYVVSDEYDAIVIGLYSSLTGMIAIQALRAKKKVFFLSTDGGIKKLDSKLKYKIKSYFISSAYAWFSTGKATTEYLKYYGANEERVYWYPFTSIKKKDIINECVTAKEKKGIKEKLHIKENKVILSVGQFIYRKGYDVLIRACKNLDNNIGVYIVGGVPTKEYLKLVNDLKISNIYFIDFLDKDRLSEYYKAADLFVLPTREDIWGLVVNEAMAYGLPVITTDKCVAGMELVKDNKNGYIVPVDDSNKLACAINQGLMEQKKLAECCISTINNYSIEQMAECYYNIICNIVENYKK